jgi:hypothetical protein
MTSRKSNVKKKAIHFTKPILRILLKTIERFIKVANKAGGILNIAKRLFHVNFLLQILIEKDIYNIHLLDLPFM